MRHDLNTQTIVFSSRLNTRDCSCQLRRRRQIIWSRRRLRSQNGPDLSTCVCLSVGYCCSRD